MSRLLLLTTFCICLAHVHSRHLTLFPWPFWPSPSKEETHPHPKLKVKEISPPVVPEGVNWFNDENKEFHSALLIAGSNSYWNYRHQSDVCHAYRILRERGMLDDNIVTFVYDDIAYNKDNPYPGKIFNKPGGVNVYPGCAKDYTGKDVNKDNIYAVMTGDSDAVKGVGSGRVLPGGPRHRIFMFYSDHGSYGTVGMPSGAPFSARELNDAFEKMRKRRMFEELVIYLESCESGSMFQGFNFENQDIILAVAASGPRESSYATYCPSSYGTKKFGGSSITPNASYIGSCMGDLFSTSWMEFAESHDVSEETIENQLDYTGVKTTDGYTYEVGSHMTVYTHKRSPIFHQVVGNFLSYFDVPVGLTSKDIHNVEDAPPANSVVEHSEQEEPITMLQRDADLAFLMNKVMSNDLEEKEKATRELEAALYKRRKADEAIRRFVGVLIDIGALEGDVEFFATDVKKRPANAQAVDDWDCFEESIDIWREICGLDDYSMQYTRTFANVCNEGVSMRDISNAAAIACEGSASEGIAT